MVQERSLRQRSSVRVAQAQEPQRGEVSLFHTLFEKDLLYFRFFVLEYPCVVCKIINYPQKIDPYNTCTKHFHALEFFL